MTSVNAANPTSDTPRARMPPRPVRTAPIRKKSPMPPPDAVSEESDMEGVVAQAVPSLARHGRGATTNPGVRFEPQTTTALDDGWGSMEEYFGALPPLETTLIRDHSRSAITRNTSPDIGFDRSINPYRGCEHGCIYCFARPTHAYLGYSPGLDFETKLVFKPEVAALLEAELRKPSYKAKPITLGSNTDPYQPVERRLKLTRSVLEVLLRFRHPVSIVTKSSGVMRDIDILQELASHQLVHVFLSVTTLDASLARVMEPRASSPALRLQAVSALSKAGVPVGVLAAPMIPGLNDAELETILKAAATAGAARAGYVLLRLPLELREMFEAWLRQHRPDRANHVLSLIRQMRGGDLNDSTFGQRFVGTGPYAEMLSRRFERATRQLGLNVARSDIDSSKFRVPAAAVAATAQMSLF